MTKQRPRLVMISSVAFAAFSAAHLIDEFVWDAPAEFHLSVEAAEVLSLLFMLALVGLAAAAARQSRQALVGLAISGLLIAAADSLKHGGEMLAPGPWRSGVVSESLAIGLTLAALSTAVCAIAAVRADR